MSEGNVRSKFCKLYTLRIRFPQTLHFTSLHFTSLHFTSLHFTSLHFTSRHFTSPSLNGFSPFASVCDSWPPHLIHFYSMNFFSSFSIGCLLTLLLPNRSFEVKTLNPVSSLATNDITFATPCCGLCEPHMIVLTAVIKNANPI